MRIINKRQVETNEHNQQGGGLARHSKRDISHFKGTSKWKQSWPPFWRVVAQNWQLKGLFGMKDFEGYNRWTLWAPMILCAYSWWRRLRVGMGWWRRRALQETVVWSPTPFNPSKLSLLRINPLKGLGHRDESFRMKHMVGQGEGTWGEKHKTQGHRTDSHIVKYFLVPKKIFFSRQFFLWYIFVKKKIIYIQIFCAIKRFLLVLWVFYGC